MSTLTVRSECAEIVGRLWPFLDGALPDGERARVIAHLEGCAGCRSHYDFAQSFLEAVRNAAPDGATEFATLRARVEAAVEAERREPPR